MTNTQTIPLGFQMKGKPNSASSFFTYIEGTKQTTPSSCLFKDHWTRERPVSISVSVALGPRLDVADVVVDTSYSKDPVVEGPLAGLY